MNLEQLIISAIGDGKVQSAIELAEFARGVSDNIEGLFARVRRANVEATVKVNVKDLALCSDWIPDSVRVILTHNDYSTLTQESVLKCLQIQCSELVVTNTESGRLFLDLFANAGQKIDALKIVYSDDDAKRECIDHRWLVSIYKLKPKILTLQNISVKSTIAHEVFNAAEIKKIAYTAYGYRLTPKYLDVEELVLNGDIQISSLNNVKTLELNVNHSGFSAEKPKLSDVLSALPNVETIIVHRSCLDLDVETSNINIIEA